MVINLKNFHRGNMFCICVYDVNVERNDKVYSTLRQYLSWLQNSVFYGEINIGELKELIEKLETIINPSEDSIVFFLLKRKKDTKIIKLGKNKEKDYKLIY